MSAARVVHTFDTMIAPVSRDTFFAEFWENKPLHIRRANKNFYDALLTVENVEAAISSGGLRYPAIKLSRGGEWVSADAFTRDIGLGGSDAFSGILDLDLITAEYQTGATVVLPAFHRAWKPLDILAVAIERSLDYAVHTNIYLTPGNATGFEPHYDTHEVFILHLSGTKKWRVHEPPVWLPERSQRFQAGLHKETPLVLEATLEPGDLLYLPRGFVHTTSTDEKSSVHITIGVSVFTWVDLVEEWAQTCRNNPEFRRALPPGFARRADVRKSLADCFPAAIATLQQPSTYRGLVDSFCERLNASRTGLRGTFQSNVTVIGLDTRVKMIAPERYTIDDSGGTTIILKIDGKPLTLPQEFRSILCEMCQRPSFCAAELSSHMNVYIVLNLLRLLHRADFLTLEQAGRNSAKRVAPGCRSVLLSRQIGYFALHDAIIRAQMADQNVNRFSVAAGLLVAVAAVVGGYFLLVELRVATIIVDVIRAVLMTVVAII